MPHTWKRGSSLVIAGTWMSGFQIGLGRNQKIITKDICHQSYTGSASNRELVTVVEAISGGGKAIPPQVSR